MGAVGGSGASTGQGPMGAMGMDMSMHKMPIIGNFFVNPQEQFKQEQFQRGAEQLGAYRPEYAQARMNALSNQSTAFQSANNLLGHMSGGQGGFRPGQMTRTPMGPGMLSVGQPASLTTPHGQVAQNGNGSGMMGALFGSGGGPQGLLSMFGQGGQGGGGFGGLPGGL